mgnify:CR=1 FL=1
MDIKDLKKELTFLGDNAIFTEIKDSNSGASVYKVVDESKTYLLKIIPKSMFNEENFQRVAAVYQENGVKSIEIVKIGSNNDKSYVVYKFIDGEALNKIYDYYNENDYSSWGKVIGKSFRKINQKKYPNILVREYNLEELTKQTITEFLSDLDTKLDYLKDILSPKFLKKMIAKFKELTRTFAKEEKVIIHMDIHPKNIVLDKDKNIHIIDIDATSYDYFVMNFRYSLLAAFKKEKNKAFFKGVIEGYYENKIPDIFWQQLLYVFILNFMEHIILFSNGKEKDYIIEYAKLIQDIFNKSHLLDDDMNLYNAFMAKEKTAQ